MGGSYKGLPMKKILLSLVGFTALTTVAHAQNAPLTYKNPNGTNGNVTMISGVGTDGKPLVPSYAAADGKQRIPLVAENVCSVVNGVPQLCQNGGGSASTPGFVLNPDNSVSSIVKLPTTDPMKSGVVWNNGGVQMQSTGSVASPAFDASNLTATYNPDNSNTPHTLNWYFGGYFQAINAINQLLPGYASLSGSIFTGNISAPNITATGSSISKNIFITNGGSATFQNSTAAGSTSIGLDNYGNLYFNPSKPGGGGVILGASTFANLPVSEPTDGVLIECSDCTYNGVQGVQLRWSSGELQWVTMDNVPVNSANISTVFNAPLSATDGNFSGNLLAGKSLQIQVPNSTVTGGIMPTSALALELVNSQGNIMDLQAGSLYSNWLIVPKTFTYSNLPSSPPEGGSAWCTNCWSSSYSGGSQDQGIPVYYNGGKWRDAVGAPVNHPLAN